ncbi:hypothetical protein DY000_02064402 [Brassica cretica]|uniref:Uncharacterized protein n=1 Tax=Brassica cretica TaxID=69181 RepID=A0ABQ7E0K1_BRACR|nr:hypothetical protein DY000_02064402 [Brassica cretica]
MLVYQHSFNDLGFTECLLSHLTSKKIHFLVPKLPAVPTTHLMLFLVLTDIVVDTPISLPLCILQAVEPLVLIHVHQVLQPTCYAHEPHPAHEFGPGCDAIADSRP